MNILGVGKDKSIIVELTEAEADMITGVAGKVHISGRYKAGKSVNVAEIYNKVDTINKKSVELKAAAVTIRDAVDTIENNIILGV